ncbi:MAG: hydrogenase maturation peptidase HycI [Nitrososphaerales archaeon]
MEERNLMEILEKELENFERLIILGIGNELRGDDGAGVLVVKKLKKVLKGARNILTIDCGTTPENFLSNIKAFNPSHILIVDAIDFKDKPGAVALFKDKDGMIESISTHRIPLSIIRSYLESFGLNIKFFLIGIQPKNILFGKKISHRVKEAISMITEILEKIIKKFAYYNI